ncbi:Protein kinase superfamily protein [Raphanus sativus]|uniref:Serine/threonine-protein kinase ZRK1-like n=1 Tax=Raphanus sativus TaxID=3726 RepID=A0A6J0JRF7_RAPSA|nr:serine/threonine-protein kinase ZRK1-like [Raphanus sativus]KAJ4890097.1 Protein kinase superfamily protein [Raphanus sativus]
MKFWRNKGKERRKQWFLDNGSTFLKELIAGCNGKTNPIRSFSSDQILKATNGFDPSRYVTSDLYYTWFTGSIEDRSYMIKMYPEEKVRGDGDGIGAVYNDIVISARVTNHINFLKLLGCCLEFPCPVLVFENAENGALGHQGGIGSKDTEFLPWDVRLKVAKEIANAVTYLHTEFPRIIVHRNITPMNVFLDNNWTAKLSDFSLALTLPEGKSQMEDQVMGWPGYLDPSYLHTSIVTEYADVYSFGIFMMVLLIGRHGMAPRSDVRFIDIRSYVRGLQEKGEFIETIYRVGVRDIVEAERFQVDKFVELTFRCCERSVEKRPKMIDVAKELKRIHRSLVMVEPVVLALRIQHL